MAMLLGSRTICRNSLRPREANEQRIQVGAFAVEIAALQHRRDVANAATAGLGVAECIIDDPVIDLLRLFHIGRRADDNLVRSLLDDPVGGDQRGCGRIELAV